MRLCKQQRGFNLIELVIIITILGVLMTGTAVYITNSIRAYSDVSRRDQLTTLGRLTVERVARSLRTALPNSVRVSNNCLEFLPILGSTVYTNLPSAAPTTTMTAIDFNLIAGFGTRYVVVYPYNTSAMYSGGSPGPRAGYGSKAGSPVTTITLSGSHQFNRHSPQRRLFVVDSPTSYCVEGTNLNRYRGYSISAAQSAPPSGGSGPQLMAQNIQLNDSGAVTPFTYTPGTLRRNGIVTLDFRFLIDGEWIRLYHEVQVRNVL